MLYENNVKNSKILRYELIYQPDFAYYFSNDLVKNNSLPEELIKLFKYNKYKSVYHFIDTSKIEFKSTGKILGFIIKDDIHIKKDKKQVTLYKNPPNSTKITKDFKIKEGLINMIMPKNSKDIQTKKKNKFRRRK